MGHEESKGEAIVIVMRVERRGKKRQELSCEEVMRLARKRGRRGRNPPEIVVEVPMVENNYLE